MIVRVPGLETPGVASAAIVETLDLFPTLVDLCSVPLDLEHALAGVSLRPLLEDPQAPWKRGAYGYWKRGRTLRTPRWRVTAPEFLISERDGKPGFVELYDHLEDPDETKNVADRYPEIVKELWPRLVADRR